METTSGKLRVIDSGAGYGGVLLAAGMRPSETPTIQQRPPQTTPTDRPHTS